MPTYLVGAVCCGVVRLVPDTPASDEVAWLRARIAELEGANARLRQAARDRDELAVVVRSSVLRLMLTFGLTDRKNRDRIRPTRDAPKLRRRH